MYIRQYNRTFNGSKHAYWALVESVRTANGPRQRIAAWLGQLDEEGRLGIQLAAQGGCKLDPDSGRQLTLFGDPEPAPAPRWVEVNLTGVRVENPRHFGGPWLALELIRRLELDEFLKRVMPVGKERIPWSLSSLILVIARLLEPSSELHTAEQWYPKTALPELLGVPAANVDDNRLYRAMDALLPHKRDIEIHLKNRMGQLFGLEYDLLLYDVTSTFFEGATQCPIAQRGHSRDQRSDCKQVCIGLVVSRCGMPLGYEVFPGNTADVTTVEPIVDEIESRYGKSQSVWVMDRGMVSEKNLAYLQKGKRKYLLGTPKSILKKYAADVAGEGWRTVRDGIEVKLIPVPPIAATVSTPEPPSTVTPDSSAPIAANSTAVEAGASTSNVASEQEIYVLIRSRDRMKKEDAMLKRFEDRIETSLKAMVTRCEKQKRDVQKVERDVGRLMAKNTRAAKLFQVKVTKREDGSAEISWTKDSKAKEWAVLSSGCYMLRSNVLEWSDEDYWKTYMQLTEAEAAFRIQKSDLSIRPIWHQKEERILSHILSCFLGYVLWKTLAQMCAAAGLGDEPRRVLYELSEIKLVDVVLPTREGAAIRLRRVTDASEHQQILLDRLGMQLPCQIH